MTSNVECCQRIEGEELLKPTGYEKRSNCQAWELVVEETFQSHNDIQTVDRVDIA